MTAVALAGQPFLLWPHRNRLPRYQQGDNGLKLFSGVGVAEKRWSGSCFKQLEYRAGPGSERLN